MTLLHVALVAGGVGAIVAGVLTWLRACAINRELVRIRNESVGDAFRHVRDFEKEIETLKADVGEAHTRLAQLERIVEKRLPEWVKDELAKFCRIWERR